ncbi:hypothetical protein ACTXT7_014210 [Hymenolepis weldensis]
MDLWGLQTECNQAPSHNLLPEGWRWQWDEEEKRNIELSKQIWEKKQIASPRMQRWELLSAAHPCETKYIPGINNEFTDAPNELPVLEDTYRDKSDFETKPPPERKLYFWRNSELSLQDGDI